MKQPPLIEDASAARILEATPVELKREVTKALRLIQLSNWLAGWKVARCTHDGGTPPCPTCRAGVTGPTRVGSLTRRNTSEDDTPPRDTREDDARDYPPDPDRYADTDVD